VKPGEYVQLSIADTGCGMDQTTRDHIFEPFFTTKRAGKGTGLGLSTAYGIVKSHGGFIYCESETGRGTNFEICLPSIKYEESAAKPEAILLDEVALSGHETVLLVDDEEDLRSITGRILVKAGYRVLEATSGEEALKIFAIESTAPDLVVLDLSMPGMGGQRTMAKLIAAWPGTKVVIASGYTSRAQIKDALSAGAASYVAKPFKKIEFLKTIRSVLDKIVMGQRV
jgi:CheY-like chemotaxis protein